MDNRFNFTGKNIVLLVKILFKQGGRITLTVRNGFYFVFVLHFSSFVAIQQQDYKKYFYMV